MRLQNFPEFFNTHHTDFEFSLCREVDPEIFFPSKGGSTKAAKRICNQCVHKADCLERALARGERYGIYGGKSEQERRRILKFRRMQIEDAA
jgi:WhiB family redox-sensing transcriptional regulator